jgi:hypothetical protein
MKTIHPLRQVSMKSHPQKKQLTFGDFIAGCYRGGGERQAEGVIRLAIKAHLIEFLEPQRSKTS